MISHCSSTFFLNLNFLILVYPGTTGKTLISVHSWIARDNRKCAVLRPCSLISPFIVEHAVLPSGNLVGTAILFCSARPHAQPLCYLTRGCLLLKEWKIQKDPSAIHATQDRVQTHAWVAPEHWNGAWRGTLLFPGLRFSKASSGVRFTGRPGRLGPGPCSHLAVQLWWGCKRIIFCHLVFHDSLSFSLYPSMKC